MTAARKPRPRMGVAEFVEMIAPFPDEERWELLDGEPVLMAPQTERHQIVVANLLVTLGARLPDRGCRVLPGLGLLSEEKDDYAPIPDVVIRCGPVIEGGYARDPILVAEVLSPSTMDWDRGGKLKFYQTIPSLQAILIVYQAELRVELWLRGHQAWRHEVHQGRSARFDVPALGGSLSIADIYDGIL